MWKNLESFKYEYQVINNQRMNLVRAIQVWAQISLPGSLALFVGSINVTVNSPNIVVAIGSWGLSSGLLIYACRIQRRYDQRIIDLYPRIIILEMMLNFHYFRNYLLDQEDVSYSEYISNVVEEYPLIESPAIAEAAWEFAWNLYKDKYKIRMRADGNRSVAVMHPVLVAALTLVYALFIAYVICCGANGCDIH